MVNGLFRLIPSANSKMIWLPKKFQAGYLKPNSDSMPILLASYSYTVGYPTSCLPYIPIRARPLKRRRMPRFVWQQLPMDVLPKPFVRCREPLSGGRQQRATTIIKSASKINMKSMSLGVAHNFTLASGVYVSNCKIYDGFLPFK